MGMDVYGLLPSRAEGIYFRASIFHWHPLISFIEESVLKNMISGCRRWRTNDGDGLDAAASKRLGSTLNELVHDGTAENYVCGYKLGARDPHLKPTEGALVEKGLPIPDEPSRFELATTIDFAEFLKRCGGFAIW